MSPSGNKWQERSSWQTVSRKFQEKHFSFHCQTKTVLCSYLFLLFHHKLWKKNWSIVNPHNLIVFSTTDKTGNETHQCSQCVRYNKKSDVWWFHCSNVNQPLMYQHLKAVVSTDDTRLCACQACHSWARRQLKRSELDSPLLDKRKTGRKVCKIDGCFQPMGHKLCLANSLIS